MKRSMIYLAMALVIYAIMMFYTLPNIQQETAGLKVFDLRPQGYTVDEGMTVVNTISEEGMYLYRFVQLPLDFIYPMLLFLFSFNLWGVLLEGSRFIHIRWLAVSVVLFDYLENIGIYFMLAGPSEIAIRLASWMSILKATSTTIVMSLILVTAIYRRYTSRSKKGSAHDQV